MTVGTSCTAVERSTEAAGMSGDIPAGLVLRQTLLRLLARLFEFERLDVHDLQ